MAHGVATKFARRCVPDPFEPQLDGAAARQAWLGKRYGQGDVMFSKKLVRVQALGSTISVLGLARNANAGHAPPAAKTKSAKITASIAGAPTGSRVLAVLSNGASSYGQVSRGNSSSRFLRKTRLTIQCDLNSLTPNRSMRVQFHLEKI